VCTDCHSPNPKVIVTLSTPEPGAGGEIVLAGPPPEWLADFPDTDPFDAVSTTCTPVSPVVGLAYVEIVDGGSGYSSTPTVTFSGGGGTPSSYIVTLHGEVASVTITNPGSGYTTPPAVSFSGGSTVDGNAAVFQSVIAGPVASITRVDRGSGYTTAPTVAVEGGSGCTATAVMVGYVFQVEITDPGGDYTSTPTVSISGGGGSGATAVATRNAETGEIVAVTVTASGDNFTSTPTVSISGGGGSGATATVVMRYRVQSVTVTAGGSGYPPSPRVTFSGGGGTGATATAAINGSVTEVQVRNAGTYRRVGFSSGAVSPNWPTLSIAGSADGTAVWNGRVVAISGGYTGPLTSVPTVAITGGGGADASAVAHLAWERDHELDVLLSEGGEIFRSYTLDATPDGDFPYTPYGESISWRVNNFQCTTHVDTFASWIDEDGGGGSAPTLVFSGEHYVKVSRSWGNAYGASVSETVWYARRTLWRKPPPDVLVIVNQPTSATPARFQATWQHCLDGKEESFWRLTGISILDAGSNLMYFAGTIYLVGEGENYYVVLPPFLTWSYSVPAAGISIGGFTTPPAVTVNFSYFSIGQYRVSSVTVTDGGETDRPDGTAEVFLDLTAGHVRTAPKLLATIANGQLVSVAVLDQGIITAPGTIAAVGSASGQQAIGHSPVPVEIIHEEPSLDAVPGDWADTTMPELSLVTAEETDSNGRSYWRVSSVTIDNPGEGYVYEGYTGTSYASVALTPPGFAVRPAAIELDVVDGEVVSATVTDGGKYYRRTFGDPEEAVALPECPSEASIEGSWDVIHEEDPYGTNTEIGDDGLSYDNSVRWKRQCAPPDISVRFE
jgi:hypothetical protein